MAKADPTNALLESLDREPEKWQRTVGVPLFKSHERTFPDGTVIKVTDGDIPGIAKRINDTIESTGRLPTFTLGHRNFGPGDEKKQPDLLGFHRNFRAEPVTRGGKTFLALVADEYAATDRASQHDVYRKFPFRSAEYSSKGGFAGAAALIQPPALDLGTVYHYAADNVRVYQTEPIPMADEAAPAPAAPAQPAAAAPAPGAEQWTAEDTAAYEIFKKYMLKFQAESAPAAPAAPAEKPAPGEPADPPADKPGDDDMDTKKYQAIDETVLALKQQVAQLEADKVDGNCRRLLDPIKSYFQFDYDRELGLMKTYADDKQRAAHVQYIADNYTKLPSTGMIQTYQGAVKPQGAPGAPVAIDPMQLTTEQHEKIKKYAADNGCTYGDAMAVVCK